MKNTLRISCVLLAAGTSSRFGADKLSVDFRGVPLLIRALDAIPAGHVQQVAAVIRNRVFLPELQARGILPVWNPDPQLGQSHSLHLGLSALAPCDGVLFLVADQPLLQRSSVAALLELWSAHPQKIAALSHEGRRGNPCLFPARFFPELQQLEGDRGGSSVIQAHRQDLLLLDVPAEQLKDVDTLQDLALLRGCRD